MNPRPIRIRGCAVAGLDLLPPVLVALYVALLWSRLVPAEGLAYADFQCFWAASKVALTEGPAWVYDTGVIRAAQRALHGSEDAKAGLFFYPPYTLLLFLPLSLLPYTASMVAWLAGTAAAYAFALRALLPGWTAVLPFLAFPAAFLNAWIVQNGFLSAALLGAAVHFLARRPVLAGVCLGCLAYKPQLGFVVPLALAAAGQWRAFAAAGATVLCLAAVASAALGFEVWSAFLANTSESGRWLEAMPRNVAHATASVFSAVLMAGGHAGWAYAAQGATAAVACALMVAALRRRPGGRAQGALMVAAIPLTTPYLFAYDLVILAVPLAWLLAEARRTGFLPWERAAFGALLAAPALAQAAVLALDVPLAPLVSAGVFAAVLRRVHGKTAGAAPPALPRGTPTRGGALAAEARA